MRPLRVKKAALGRVRTAAREQPDVRERCGLCGKGAKPLARTECCGSLICDDEGDYVPFSYARNSCFRNHRRYTLCGYHHGEGHAGDWKTCEACREDFSSELEMYVYYGTNAYNLEKLEDPPSYEPTRCGRCRRVIVLGEDAYGRLPDRSYRCQDCLDK